MEIKDRMDEVRAWKKLSDKAFERLIGTSNGNWRKTKSVSEEVLLNFLESFPEISSEWLLRGKGEMVTTPAHTAAKRQSTDKELLALCRTLIDSYEQRDSVMLRIASVLERLE